MEIHVSVTDIMHNIFSIEDKLELLDLKILLIEEKKKYKLIKIPKKEKFFSFK